MSGKRVYFFNRFFWPDNSATAQILTDLCHSLDDRDLSITVVTSRLNYGDASVQYPPEQHLGDVRIRRLWSTRFGRGNTLGRLVDYLTIYLSFFWFALRHIGPREVAVFKTDPPLLSVPGAVAKQLKDFRMVSWCQDLFPEVAVSELHIPRGTAWAFRLIAAIRDWSLSVSERVVVLGDDMRAFLENRGIDANKLVPISNWSVQKDSAAVSRQPADLRREWGIPEDTFVVGYSGNLGRAHDWRTVLDAAKRMCDEAGLLFLVCGGGYGYERMREAVDAEGLTGAFRFLPYQPLEDLDASLRLPDVHWFTLKERLTPFIYPSKFFGILQAGRPVVFVGGRDCELARLIRENRMGAVVSEGDPVRLADALLQLKEDASFRREAGQRARLLWENRYQKEKEVDKWRSMLDSLHETGEQA